jgi:predicted N-acetyltransferase YhbS
MQNLIIRNEEIKDQEIVENMTRNAFWNLYVPGCNEHYLVHILRNHEDFIPELNLVAVLNSEIVGNIMYTRSKLIDEDGQEKSILTFGPLTVHKNFQRRGIGKALLKASFEIAIKLSYDVIVIFGNPGNYVTSGFKSCKKYNIQAGNKTFPTAMLVKELKENALDGRKWVYQDSVVYSFDEEKAEEYDKKFEPKDKGYKETQEEFYIYSNSTL